MDLARGYFERAEEIIGVRTPAEERYDREVLRHRAAGPNPLRGKPTP